jgi:hypothetical protein
MREKTKGEDREDKSEINWHTTNSRYGSDVDVPPGRGAYYPSSLDRVVPYDSSGQCRCDNGKQEACNVDKCTAREI